MRDKAFPTLSALIFALGAGFHLLRMLAGWPIQVGRVTVPVGLSVPALALLGTLSIWGFTRPSGAYLGLGGVLFALASALMLARYAFDLPLRIGALDVPRSASAVAAVVTACLSAWSLAQLRR